MSATATTAVHLLYGRPPARLGAPLTTEQEALLDEITGIDATLRRALPELRRSYRESAPVRQRLLIEKISSRAFPSHKLLDICDLPELRFLQGELVRRLPDLLVNEEPLPTMHGLLLRRPGKGGPLAVSLLAFHPEDGQVNYPLAKHFERLPSDIIDALNYDLASRSSWLGQAIITNLTNSACHEMCGPSLQAAYKALGGRRSVMPLDTEWRSLKENVTESLFPLPSRGNPAIAASELRAQLVNSDVLGDLGAILARVSANLKRAALLTEADYREIAQMMMLTRPHNLDTHIINIVRRSGTS